MDQLYYWRVRTKLPERFGQACRCPVRGRKNSVLVVFEDDGFQVVTSRHFIRKEAPPGGALRAGLGSLNRKGRIGWSQTRLSGLSCVNEGSPP